MLLLLTALVAFFPATTSDPPFAARCVGVVDGDTIDVLHNGHRIRIRLEGIDAPERDQHFGVQAKQFVAQRVFDREVVIRPCGRDDHDRIVARVLVRRRDSSVELVRAGWAWHFKAVSADPVLAAAETKARKKRIGLWSSGIPPLAPWHWRAGIIE